MAQITSLGISGLPTAVKVFLAKGLAVSGVKGTGQFTVLSPLGISGKVRSFYAKSDSSTSSADTSIDPFFWGWWLGGDSIALWGWTDVTTADVVVLTWSTLQAVSSNWATLQNATGTWSTLPGAVSDAWGASEPATGLWRALNGISGDSWIGVSLSSGSWVVLTTSTSAWGSVTNVTNSWKGMGSSSDTWKGKQAVGSQFGSLQPASSSWSTS